MLENGNGRVKDANLERATLERATDRCITLSSPSSISNALVRSSRQKCRAIVFTILKRMTCYRADLSDINLPNGNAVDRESARDYCVLAYSSRG